MLWGIWAVAGVAFFGLWMLYHLQDGRSQGLALTYRRNYLKLTDSLESLVAQVNKLDWAAKSLNDVRALDAFHGHLKMLETLMEAVRAVPPFGTSVATLQAPLFLVEDITDRVILLSKDMSKAARVGSHTVPLTPAPLLGCYFCSRPFDPALFSKVRVRVEGVAQDVAACKVCNEKLTSGKKAKVLFFSEGGDTVHWTKAKDYTPAAQFWGINAAEAESPGPDRKSEPHLKLVYSNLSKLTSQIKLE